MKTTILGILTIISAIAPALASYLKTGVIPDLQPIGSAILAGWALIHAADAKPASP